MKILVAILPIVLLPTIMAMSQNQEKISVRMQLPKDTLISRAMDLLRQQYPKVCTTENGFTRENFSRITLERTADDVIISFGHVFYISMKKKN